jgi:outer membrane protein assembly factor BamB
MYAGATNGEFYAFSATGCGDDFCTPLWKAQLSNGVHVTPAVVNGVVYVESAGTDDGRLYAFKAAGCGAPECKPLWTAVNHGNVGSSPTVANGFVYTASSDGHLYAYNALGCGAAECKAVWSGVIGDTSSEGAPAVSANATGTNSVVYVAGDKQLHAFRAGGCGQATCKPIWSSKPLDGVEIFQESGPSLSGKNVYIASSDTSVSIGRVYSFAAAGCGQSICGPQWVGRVDQNNFEETPAVANGFVYITATDGLFAFNANGCGRLNCTPVWRGEPANGGFAGSQGSPVVAGGVVYSVQNNSTVAAYDAKGCGEDSCPALWFFLTQDSIVNSPVIVNGRLYVAGSNFGITPEVYVFHLFNG